MCEGVNVKFIVGVTENDKEGVEDSVGETVDELEGFRGGNEVEMAVGTTREEGEADEESVGG